MISHRSLANILWMVSVTKTNFVLFFMIKSKCQFDLLFIINFQLIQAISSFSEENNDSLKTIQLDSDVKSSQFEIESDSDFPSLLNDSSIKDSHRNHHQDIPVKFLFDDSKFVPLENKNCAGVKSTQFDSFRKTVGMEKIRANFQNFAQCFDKPILEEINSIKAKSDEEWPCLAETKLIDESLASSSSSTSSSSSSVCVSKSSKTNRNRTILKSLEDTTKENLNFRDKLVLQPGKNSMVPRSNQRRANKTKVKTIAPFSIHLE